MGLKLTITAAGGAPVTLADDADMDLARSGFACNGERAVDVQGRLRAAFVAIFDRKNKVKRITFRTQMQHDTPLEAIRHVLDHDDDIPTQGLVELEISDGTDTFKRWFYNAAVQSVVIPRQLGTATWQEYSIVCGQTLKSNPFTS